MILLEFNFKGQWATFWGAVTSAAPQLVNALGFVAFLILLFALVKYFIERAKGSGGNTKKFLGMALIAGIFALPNILLPMVLGVFDWVANIAVQFLQKFLN